MRHITAVVLFDPAFPPAKDTPLDLSLLHAAHQALLRKEKGLIDAFLFVIASDMAISQMLDMIERYGFPHAEVRCIEISQVTDEEQSRPLEIEELGELAGWAVEQWITKQHPGAIAAIGAKTYDGLNAWWRGIESADASFQWPFETARFASELPASQYGKAATWLCILEQACELDEPSDWISQNRASVLAATLCEWLHGFEAASGNSYNHFEPMSVYESLSIHPFSLGFLLGHTQLFDSLEELSCEYDDDLDAAISAALRHQTEDNRSGLRDALSAFFGGNTALYWAMHSVIWPEFERAIEDACNAHVSLDDVDIGDVDEAWQFVSDGWSESADP